MVIIRESPNAKQPSQQPHWPPRSPYEAQLLSPSGRKRLQQLQRDLSPSPTPRKRLAPNLGKTMALSDSDEDEDEETLQLKLQAIEAKLKLKKIQKAKSSGKVPSGNAETDNSRPRTVASKWDGRSRSLERSISPQVEIQVPFSPVRDRRPPPEPKSPARVILGIDKGLRAQDVSLKRSASSRLDSTSNRWTPKQAAPTPKVKSFSERIAESRISTLEQQAKDERIKQSRSKGFGLAESADIFNSPRTASRQTESSRASSRDEMLPPSSKRAAVAPSSRGNDSSNLSSSTSSAATSHQSTSSLKRPARSPEPRNRPREIERNDSNSSTIDKSSSQDTAPVSTLPEASSTFESYTGLHLTKRTMDHAKVTRALHGKEIYTLPRLLKEVKSPDYEPPDCESDYIVMGIIASKSTPHDHKTNPKSINSAGEDGSRPKFMALRLTDLKWEVDLFLFDTGFDQFWKLKQGTVVAILNPGIMPPRVRESGAFSLKVTSCEDTILEIGTAQDLGFCKATKSDGKQCTQWIDKRKTEVCEFHIALQVDKARKARMQFNTMPGFGGGLFGGKGRGRGGKSGSAEDGLKREGRYHDKYLHETMYIAPKEYGISAATMLDEKSLAEKKGITEKEASRKRRQDRLKEAELARTLGMKGNGAGSEYLSHHHNLPPKDTASRPSMASSSAMLSGGTDKPPDAKTLGLLSNTAASVSLSPVKGRKRGFNTSSSKSHEAMGWSGAFKRGIYEPKETSPPPEAGQTLLPYTKASLVPGSPHKSSMRQLPRPSDENGADVQSSPRKRARLVLPEKGIRIPGRESLGGKSPGDVFLSDDDDDRLDIV